MLVKQIYDTRDKDKLLINLPEHFRGKKKVLVVLDDSIEIKDEKYALMQKAANDPLFISDIENISEDFLFSDSEL